MKKRGMSAVVTTLLIILLAIVAVGVVWVVVKNLVSKGSEEITLTGLTLDLEIIKASVNDGNLSITVKRNSGEGNLVGINFIISDGDYSDVLRRDTTLQQLGVGTFVFELDTIAVGDIRSISVAPIYETSSGKEVTAEPTDVVTYSAGEVGSGGGAGSDDGDGGDGGCVPVCDDFECGDDGCGGVCGTCSEGETCGGDNMCYSDTCVEDDNATTCAPYECGVVTGNCGQQVDCDLVYGTCPEQHEGDSSWNCNPEINLCEYATFEEAGTIDNVWPLGTGIYFDSEDLAQVHGIYYGYSVAFSSDETQCYLIVGYSYDPAVYPNAIAELYLFEPLGISEGDIYEIWENIGDCTSALPVD